MDQINFEVLKRLAASNKKLKVKTVHVRFMDKHGYNIDLETGMILPYNANPVHHFFYFGMFTKAQALRIAKLAGLRAVIHNP